MLQVICCVLINQLVVGLPVAYISYHMMMWRGFPPLRELPTFHWVLAELALFIIIEEISFYYSHRCVLAFVQLNLNKYIFFLIYSFHYKKYIMYCHTNISRIIILLNLPPPLQGG